MKLHINNKEQLLTAIIDSENNQIEIEGKTVEFEIIYRHESGMILRIDNKIYTVGDQIVNGFTTSFTLNGNYRELTVKTDQEVMLENMGFTAIAESSEGELKTPMPGKILTIMVTEGEDVEFNQPIIILEAMKMENELKAPIGGKVIKIYKAEGTNVEKNEVLIEIENIG